MRARHQPWVPGAVALLAAAVGACSSRTEPQGEAASPPPRSAAAVRADLDHPLEALRVSADDAAARIGSFAWEGEVTWTVEKPGVAPVKSLEHHRVRQIATGEFEASSDIDPGTGPGSETGKHVVYVGGLTYGRGRWSPYRERLTDRGHGARRFRDQSFRMAADLAELCGPGLVAEPAGDTTTAGRRARRYRLSLDPARRPAQPTTPTGVPGGTYDPDTKRHAAFLDGRVPTAIRGEVLLDVQTGVPLAVTLEATFSEKDDPQLTAAVQLHGRIASLGAAVAPVQAPKGALADERKPKGVARALEAAGLRNRAGRAEQREEDVGEEPATGDE